MPPQQVLLPQSEQTQHPEQGQGRLGAHVAGVGFGIYGSHGGRQLYLGKKEAWSSANVLCG